MYERNGDILFMKVCILCGESRPDKLTATGLCKKDRKQIDREIKKAKK